MGWLAEPEGTAAQARFLGAIELVETRFLGGMITSRAAQRLQHQEDA
jgi:hypothetical protein